MTQPKNRPGRAAIVSLIILMLFPAVRHAIFSSLYNILMFLVAAIVLFVLWAFISPAFKRR